MAAIDDLIAQIDDPALRERLEREVAELQRTRKFGLVFEQHLPELLPIYSATPRLGDFIGRRGEPLTEPWLVLKVERERVHVIRHGEKKAEILALSEVVVVRQFGDPIFPALIPMEKVQNGPKDAPWHTLIEADNYHALQLLEYLYAGQVDCIYIDPPYNTGARDWKYNNDYVDANDGWRHSKWLAMMRRRLILAKRLLKKNTGVLIVTIDEHELHHLGMLLEDIFPEYLRHVVTLVINPKGTGKHNFARVEEYAFFCVPDIGTSVISPEPSAATIRVEVEELEDENSDDDIAEQSDLVDAAHPFPDTEVEYWELRHARRRGGESSYRHQRPNQFYPLYVDPTVGKVVRAGIAPAKDSNPDFQPVDGLIPVWPIDAEGNHRCWRFVPESMQALIDSHRVVLGRYNEERNTWTINYWVRKAESRKLKTVWWSSLHDAGTHGTTFLYKVLGRRNAFPFPKSVYAVRDCLAAVVRDRRDALIVDFFAGSGTTLNAVNLLNLADGGRRRCVQVTNNEISEALANALANKGIQPDTVDWQGQGISRAVTWPRSKFTILGKRDDGTELPGDYLTGQIREVERARQFTHVGFLDRTSLNTEAKKKQLVSLIDGLPQTLVDGEYPFIVSKDHPVSVLFDETQSRAWLKALEGQDHIARFMIVAPTKRRFDELKSSVNKLLGPLVVGEELRQPISDGFPANLEYFRLDFLDKDQVALKRRFREILPLLWMRAGCVGPRPEIAARKSEPTFLLPEGNTFAVLLDEMRFAEFSKLLTKRKDLTHVFLVTDSHEAFEEMAAKVNVQTVIQLYRDYLENFLINRGDVT